MVDLENTETAPAGPGPLMTDLRAAAERLNVPKCSRH